jgi:hypothetical protein
VISVTRADFRKANDADVKDKPSFETHGYLSTVSNIGGSAATDIFTYDYT